MLLDLLVLQNWRLIKNAKSIGEIGEMVATAKPVNYTPEQTAQMVKAAAEGQSVEQIAQTMGRSVRSVTIRLSREGAYKKKEYITKN